MKLNVSKSKMYNLVSDIIGNLPKMKDTEFKSYTGTYWLEYRNTQTDHLMKVCLDKYAGSIHLLVSDRTGGDDYMVKLSVEELTSRGMIVKTS